MHVSETSEREEKEGKGGEGSGKLGENDFWDGFKKEWLECENEECKIYIYIYIYIWVSMRVPEGV